MIESRRTAPTRSSRSVGIVVRPRDHDRVDTVRRRLNTLASTYQSLGPEPLNSSDTRLVVTGPELELTAWHCAQAVRELLLGEIDVRIICYLADHAELTRELPEAVRVLLECAEWNFVIALTPFADALSLSAVDDAGEWQLRRPPGQTALVSPASDIRQQTQTFFEAKLPVKLRRYVRRVRDDQASDIVSLLDSDGFLKSTSTSDKGVLPVLDVLRECLALIVAPPWTGKTYVAERIRELISHAPGMHVSLTNLESHDENLTHAPLDWRKWRDSKSKLIWLIDAVDEALHRGGTLSQLRSHLNDLGEARSRLRLVLFTRDDDTKPRIIEFFKKQAALPIEVFQLLPIDRAQAAQYLERPEDSGKARLERALSRMAKARLGNWSGHLPMLARAADLPDSDSHEIRDRLLEALCTENVTHTEADVPVEKQLNMAARLAAVMTLSRMQSIADDAAASPGASLLFSSDTDEPAFRALTQRGPLLVRTAGGYRFRQEHARELLAAYGLKDLRLGILRRLTTTRDGVQPEFSELIEQLKPLRPNDSPELEAWQQIKPIVWPPGDAIDKLKRLEDLMPQSWPGLYIHERTAQRLNHPKVRSYLLDRTQDEAAHPEARRLYLTIAEENRWPDFTPEALKIALDEAATWALRNAAVSLLVALGTKEQRDALKPLLNDRSDDGSEARAQVLLGMLQEGEDVLEVARHMPRPRLDLSGPSPWILQSALEARLELRHARVIMDACASNTETQLPREIASLLVKPALVLLTESQVLRPEDRARIVRHVRQLSDGFEQLLDTWKERLAREPGLRRDSYLQFCREAQNRRLLLLLPEDTDWLIEQIQLRKAPDSSASELPDLAAASIDPDLRARAQQFLKEHYPAVYAEWQNRECAATERESAETHRPHPQRSFSTPWMGELVAEAISFLGQPERRLHELSALCFQRQPPARVRGTFAELSIDFKQRVIDRVKDILTQAEPTPLPTQQGPYPNTLRLEGEAFCAAVTWEDPSPWLTDELIRRWLPAALFAADSELFETGHRCATLSPNATAEAVVIALESEARSKDYSRIAQNIPDRLWTHRDVLDTGRALVERGELSVEYRAALLRALAERAWSETRTLVMRLLHGEDKQLRAAAVSCLVLREPERAVEHLDTSWSDRELARVLEPISVYTGGGGERLRQWPQGAVVGLLRWLTPRALPPQIPPGQVVFLGDGDRLRAIHDRLESRLDEMTTAPEYEQIVQELEGPRPELAANRRSAKASYEALRLFSEPLPPVPPLHDIIAALDGARSLDFRDEHDLADALLEALQTIAQTSKNDLPDLAGGTSKPHERVLQSYVSRRLSDLLQFERHKLSFLVREPKEGREEPDICVIAKGGDGRKLEVPIEIKWSHHKSVLPDLQKQLGTRYLRRAHRRRGIYLVGFSGLPPITDKDDLTERLEREARSFQAKHPEVHIDAVVLDTCLLHAKAQRTQRSTASTKRAIVRKKRPLSKEEAGADCSHTKVRTRGSTSNTKSGRTPSSTTRSMRIPRSASKRHHR